MTDDPATILLELFEADSQKYFDEPAGTPVFDRPEVAVANADDPRFERFKDVIGGFYWTPNEALALADAGARGQSVICWSLPVAQIAREANRRQTETPARQWAYDQFRDVHAGDAVLAEHHHLVYTGDGCNQGRRIDHRSQRCTLPDRRAL